MVQSVSKKQHGFTLIELMVTVAVLTIALTVAVPSFTNLINGNRLTSQANELLSAMSFARSEAIRLNRNVILCHSTNSSSCSEPAGGEWAGWIVLEQGGDTVLATGLIHNQLVTRASSALANSSFSIRYNAQGFIRHPTNNNLLSASLRVCSPSGRPNPNARDVQFISGGRVSITPVHDENCSTPGNS
ncbi:GspH/FimT family pseudopilin [Alkalimonas collagenimarina]|uniref:Type II secretion system protein H n=1 Tax=Alkalimonas collagenimarina TaxID=400390 RepID=A0ABT9H0L1_9GAMM|nr:GspH/FimT family pseudopilin [Alkalimonas collagenimarina]MDP4536857.1 GspH/FimT family pseudopilin [Alkalimonas collagenimarina]